MGAFCVIYQGNRYPVRQGETTLGRSPYSSVIVDNARSSREHATIRLSGKKLEILDLGSTNGTFVNGKKIDAPRVLAVGDRIVIGTETLEIIERQTPSGAGGQSTMRIAAVRTPPDSEPTETGFRPAPAMPPPAEATVSFPPDLDEK